MSGGASKALLVLRVIVYLIIIGGAALWGYGLYKTRGQWSYRLSGRPAMNYEPPYTLKVTVPLEIYDPAGPVMAKLVYYQVYINGYPAGSGLIPYVHLVKGWNNLTVTTEVDLSQVTCGLAHALAQGENVTITVKGYAMVDIKTVGGLTWKTITVPFSKEAGQVETPQLSGPARLLIGFYDRLCGATPANATAPPGGSWTSAITILSNITSITSIITNPTSQLPPLPTTTP